MNLRIQLPGHKYELLTSLVETSRRLGLFHYPNMLAQHTAAPIALAWVSVEEMKRFGLALYKLCRLVSQSRSNEPAKEHRIESGVQSELLTLEDLDFCLPDSDEVWNMPPGPETEPTRINTALQETCRDNRDSNNWISRTSGLLHDASVNFDWI